MNTRAWAAVTISGIIALVAVIWADQRVGIAHDCPCSLSPTPAPLVAPVITSSTTGDRSLTIHWDDHSIGVKSRYDLAWRVLPDGEWKWVFIDRWSKSHTLWNLVNGANYIVFVRAVSSTEFGPWSEPTFATPVTQPTPTPVPTPTPKSTPTPVPTPVPTSTITPVPTPTPISGLLPCAARTAGTVDPARDHIVIEQVSKNVEVTFVNPPDSRWRYGLKVTWGWGWFGGGRTDDLAMFLEVTSDGEWILRENDHIARPRVKDSGRIDDGALNPMTGDRNQITFYTMTPDDPYRLFVNGVEVPVDFSQLKDLAIFKEEEGSYSVEVFERILERNHTSRYNVDRRYDLIADQRTDYEGLCARNSWE